MDSDCSADWIRLAGNADVADESAVHVQVGKTPVCLARSRGRLHAIIDRCTHQDVPLSEGEVEDGTIECYLHGSRFDLESGRALGPPAIKDVTVFAVRVDGEDVYVAVPAQRRDRVDALLGSDRDPHDGTPGVVSQPTGPPSCR